MPANDRAVILHRLAGPDRKNRTSFAQIESLDVENRSLRQRTGTSQTFLRLYVTMQICSVQTRRAEPIAVQDFMRAPFGCPMACAPSLSRGNFPLQLVAGAFAPALAAGNNGGGEAAGRCLAFHTSTSAPGKRGGNFQTAVINVVTGLGETAGDGVSAASGHQIACRLRGRRNGSDDCRIHAAESRPVKLELGGKGARCYFRHRCVRAAARALAGQSR